MSLNLRAAHHFRRHRQERHILATVGVLDSRVGVLNRCSLFKVLRPKKRFYFGATQNNTKERFKLRLALGPNLHCSKNAVYWPLALV